MPNSKYTPEEIAATRAAQTAHGLKMMEAHPGNLEVSDLARRVMTQSPEELLDALAAQANPTPF